MDITPSDAPVRKKKSGYKRYQRKAKGASVKSRYPEAVHKIWWAKPERRIERAMKLLEDPAWRLEPHRLVGEVRKVLANEIPYKGEESDG